MHDERQSVFALMRVLAATRSSARTEEYRHLSARAFTRGCNGVIAVLAAFRALIVAVRYARKR